MSENPSSRTVVSPKQRRLFLVLLLLVTMGGAFVALVLPHYQSLAAQQLHEGEVAAQDIVAPQSITYLSEIRTAAARASAERSVQPIYTPADPTIARRQLERLRAALTYINSVRADAWASTEQKEADLAALEDISLRQEIVRKLLNLSEARWQAVQQETIAVLEEVMRSTIREDRLAEAQRSAPRLVSLSLPEDQAVIVAEVAAGFIAPNSFYSESMTETARQQARDAVAPINQSFVAGEIIVPRGRVITATDMEALQQLGLAQPMDNWQPVAGAGSITVLGVLFILLYLQRDPKLTGDVRGLTVIALLFLTFLFVARMILPGHTVIPYAFPLAGFGLTVAALFGMAPALIFTLPLAVLTAYDLQNPLTLTLVFLMDGVFGVLALGQARRLASFFWAFVAMSISGTLVVLGFRLPETTLDWSGIATLTGAVLLNAFASAILTAILQFVLAQFLGLTTALQLVEISRPDHPLLQFILRNAPGTYQHSLQVANLAEQAAERIGADALLTRIGALYHDAGKALEPFYFIENQLPDSPNPHNRLDPVDSSAIIIRHISDGMILAQKYRLPRRIRDFIREHHGTMLARYQYAKAVEAAGGDASLVPQDQFLYPGPRPQSRETAILMLADGSEARVRAERPKDEEAMRVVIKSVIENRLAAGQLDDTDLTLKDLDEIADSFASTLRGIYHPRLEYPQLAKTIPASVSPEPLPKARA
jgi:putative nucleotidyltransferase with HDIG domain